MNLPSRKVGVLREGQLIRRDLIAAQRAKLAARRAYEAVRPKRSIAVIAEGSGICATAAYENVPRCSARMFNDDIFSWQRQETVLNFHVHKPNGTEDAANHQSHDQQHCKDGSAPNAIHSRTSYSKATPSGSFSSNQVSAASTFANTLR